MAGSGKLKGTGPIIGEAEGDGSNYCDIVGYFLEGIEPPTHKATTSVWNSRNELVEQDLPRGGEKRDILLFLGAIKGRTKRDRCATGASIERS
jgi:hypothetical protein